MPAEFLSPLAKIFTLITIDYLVRGLVYGQLKARFDLFVTNITSKERHNFSRVNILDVRGNMTYSFHTFCTVEHVLEVNSHVFHHAPLLSVLVVAQFTRELILHPFRVRSFRIQKC